MDSGCFVKSAHQNEPVLSKEPTKEPTGSCTTAVLCNTASNSLATSYSLKAPQNRHTLGRGSTFSELMGRAAESFGRVDVVVANAGTGRCCRNGCVGLKGPPMQVVMSGRGDTVLSRACDTCNIRGLELRHHFETSSSKIN